MAMYNFKNAFWVISYFHTMNAYEEVFGSHVEEN